MNRLRVFSLLAALCTLCCFSTLSAQDSTIAPRVLGPVDDASRITVAGSLTPLAQPQFDRGEASPATEFHNVRLVVHRSPQQEAALNTFMAEQLDRHSPNFHHWLTPDKFEKLYGLADSDASAITFWLQSHGLKVESVTSTDIAFSGKVPQIEEALRVSIHSFVTPNGHQFYANTTEPSIPAAFKNVIRGVAFLNTIRPLSHAIAGPAGKYDAQAKKLAPSQASAVHAHPDLTIGGQYLYVVPADAATIYDTPNSYNAAFSSGTSYTGSGVTIGIGGDSAIKTTTVGSFRSVFLNGDTKVPTVIDVGAAGGHPAQVNGDQDEAYLDNEVSGGLAPGAAIDFYVSDQATTNGIYDAIPQMITDNKVDIFSLSFGYCELLLGTTTNQQFASWWQEAAADGITVVVSTGDDGSAGCDNQDKVTIASLGLNVSGFSTTPYNVAVGGTDYYGLLNGGFSTYVNSNQGSSNSYRSALGYIPESTWNDSTTNNGLISANVATVSNAATNIIGGTGGRSNCSTNTTTFTGNTTTAGTCTSGYAKPSWQTGAGVPADGDRDVPDVSLLSGNGFYGATWLVCTDDVDQSSSEPENCTNQGGTFYFAGIGGTSASTPAFAGILALVVQANGSRIGIDGAKFLYDIYNGSSGAAAFHDITQGNNSVLCTSATPDCTVSVGGGDYFESGYQTGPGYDLATGLGSVDAAQLIAGYLGLSGGGGGGGPAFSLSNSGSISVSAGSSGTGTLTVAPSGGFTGQVNFSCLVSGSPTGLSCSANSATITGTSSATATLTVATTPSTPASTYTATVTGADAATGNITSTTTLSVTVTSSAPSGTFSLGTPSTPASVSPGGSTSSTVTVTGSNGYSGTVSFTCSLTNSPTGAVDLPSCSAGSGVPLSSSTTSGTSTMTVTTTAASTASLDRRGLPGWLGAAGGTSLAVLIFFGIPKRRRSLRNFLGMLVVLAVLGSLSACGGGGGSNGGGGGGGGGGNSDPGTTPGNYTFTVTGTGSPAGGGPYTATFNVTVN